MSLEVALAVFEYVVMVLALSFHDMVQAWTASRLGDQTARMLGRITMNPVKHYDLLGTIVFPVIFIYQSPLVLGWTKPVPMTTRNFGKRGEMLVYASGPVAHLFAAAVCLVALLVLKHTVPAIALALPVAAALSLRDTSVATVGLPQVFPVVLFLYYGILVNLLLFAFNLVPLPSLDGGKVLRYFLPYNAKEQFDRMGFWLMIAFFFVGFRIILTIMSPLMGLFNGLLFAL
jgi:Zn-dependent protease